VLVKQIAELSDDDPLRPQYLATAHPGLPRTMTRVATGSLGETWILSHGFGRSSSQTTDELLAADLVREVGTIEKVATRERAAEASTRVAGALKNAATGTRSDTETDAECSAEGQLRERSEEARIKLVAAVVAGGDPPR